MHEDALFVCSWNHAEIPLSIHRKQIGLVKEQINDEMNSSWKSMSSKMWIKTLSKPVNRVCTERERERERERETIN